jgi:DNA polymerase-3 subunit beta
MLKRKEVIKMQMRVERLREALKLVQPVVHRKTTLPVLSNILLKDGEAAATDLEVTVTLALPEVEGECLIPHHAVSELLKYVPGDEMLTIESAGKPFTGKGKAIHPSRGRVHLDWKGGKASYDVAEVNDYPPIPGVKATAEAAVDGDNLVKALMSVVGYCARDDSRPVLSGVTVALGEVAEVVAADGFRMAYQTMPMSFPAEDMVIIPANAVRILEHLWEGSPFPGRAVPLGNSLISQIIGKREINLAIGDGVICARFGRVTFIVKLIQGTPPNFRQLIPSDPPLKVQVFASDMERAVRRLRDIAEDSKGIIRFTWTESAMTLSAKSDEKGSVEAEVPVKAEGGTGRVALNAGYLLEYLKGREGLVTMGVTTETSPVIFRHGTSPLVLIMPLGVQW